MTRPKEHCLGFKERANTHIVTQSGEKGEGREGERENEEKANARHG